MPLRRAGNLAVVPLLILAVSACGNSEAKNATPSTPATTKLAVTVAPAEARNLPTLVEVTGTLMADAQSEVASEGSGRVVEAPVERGMVVSTGAVLARLDDQDARNALREAEATAAQTQAKLGLAPDETFDVERTADVRRARVVVDRAEAEHRRYEQLVDQGYVSRSEYDVKRADYLTARQLLDAAANESRQLYQTLLAQRARAAMARKALDDTVVRAPFGGPVAERHVSIGQYVQKGARVATLMRVDPLRVELTVPEAAVASVRRGQKVWFTVQAYPDRRFDGTIAYVGPSLRPDSRALVVEAIVPNAQRQLQPGLFASARIELPAGKVSVLVPSSAVRSEAGVARLFVVKNGRAELRFVQPGREIGDRLEVARGVVAGEAVVSTFDDQLADGAEVQIAPSGTASAGGR
jgi:RND family efflux transporter MFP subunit